MQPTSGVIWSLVLLIVVTLSTSNAKPQGIVEAQSPLSESSSTTAAPSGSSSTVAAPSEESKVSKFFEDVSMAFKHGTAKVKESFESAATSVKDGVLRGYGYVKDKLTGTSDPATPSSSPSTMTTPSTVSTTAADAIDKKEAISARSLDMVQSGAANTAAAGTTTTAATKSAVKVEPNDEDIKSDDRIIFVNEEETGTDTPTLMPNSTKKTNLDDRFIIDGPQACKSGQTIVNGKCRNTF